MYVFRHIQSINATKFSFNWVFDSNEWTVFQFQFQYRSFVKKKKNQ